MGAIFGGDPLGGAFIEIGGDLSRYSKDIEKARKLTDAATTKMSKDIRSKLSGAFRDVSGFVEKHRRAITGMGRAFTIAGAAITGGMTAAVYQTVQLGDSLDKMSKRTGIAVETLSELGYAAEITGSDLGTVEKSMRFLARAMDDMQRGVGEGKDKFEKLGLAVTDSDGKLRSVVDVMKDAAEKIAVMGSETEQVATATDLFGSRFGTALLPLLKEGRTGIEQLTARARELGIVVSTETATASAELNDAWTDLKWTLKASSIELGSVLLPAVQSLTEGLTNTISRITAWAKEHPRLTSTLTKFAFVMGGIMATGGPLLMMAPTIVSIGRALAVATPFIAGFGAAALTATPYVAGLAAAAYALYRGIQYLKSPVDQAKIDLDVFKQRASNLQDAVDSVAGALQVYGQTGDRTSATIGDLGLNTGLLSKQTGLLITESDNAERVIGALEQAFYKASEKADAAAAAIKKTTEAVGDSGDEVADATKAWASYSEALAEAVEFQKKLDQGIQNVEKAQAAQKQILSTYAAELGKISEEAERAIGEGVKEYQFRPPKIMGQEMGIEGFLPQKEGEAYDEYMKRIAARRMELEAGFRDMYARDLAQQKQWAARGAEIKEQEIEEAQETRRKVNEWTLAQVVSINEATEREELERIARETELWEQGKQDYIDSVKDRQKATAAFYEQQKKDMEGLYKEHQKITKDLEKNWKDVVDGWTDYTEEYGSIASGIARSTQYAFTDLFASMIDPSVKPAWAQFWDDLKSIAINALAEIAVKMAALQWTKAGLPGAEAMLGGAMGALGTGIGALGIGGTIAAGVGIAAGGYGLYKLFDTLLDKEDKADKIRNRMAGSLEQIAGQNEEINKSINSAGEAIYSATRNSARSIVDAIFSSQREGRPPVPRVPGISGEGTTAVELSRLARLQASRPGRPRTLTEYKFGGIADKPTYALIGEKQKEAVIPLAGNKYIPVRADSKDRPFVPLPGGVKIPIDYEMPSLPEPDLKSLHQVISAIYGKPVKPELGDIRIGADMPDLELPQIGGISIPLSFDDIKKPAIPRIPAQGFKLGGIIDKPTFALIGEGEQKEAIVPLEDNKFIPMKMDRDRPFVPLPGGMKIPVDMDIKPFQMGGIVTRPDVKLMGETGPEPIFPSRRGTAIVQPQQGNIQRTVIDKLEVNVTAEFPNANLDTMTRDQFQRLADKVIVPTMNEWIWRGNFHNARR